MMDPFLAVGLGVLTVLGSVLAARVAGRSNVDVARLQRDLEQQRIDLERRKADREDYEGLRARVAHLEAWKQGVIRNYVDHRAWDLDRAEAAGISPRDIPEILPAG